MVGSIYYRNTQAIGTKRSMFKVIFSYMVTQRPSWGMYLSLDFFFISKIENYLTHTNYGYHFEVFYKWRQDK